MVHDSAMNSAGTAKPAMIGHIAIENAVDKQGTVVYRNAAVHLCGIVDEGCAFQNSHGAVDGQRPVKAQLTASPCEEPACGMNGSLEGEVAARVDRNSGNAIPRICKCYCLLG